MRAGGRLRRTDGDLLLSLAIIAGLALLPLFVGSAYWLGVVVVALYFALQSQGWNLLAGYTGQFSLAPAAFAMLGAYATAIPAFHWHWPLWIGLPLAAIVPAIVGVVLGWVVMRLSGAYLALTTLAFGEILRLVVRNSIGFTRGDLGLDVPALMQSRLGYYYLFLFVLFAVTIILFLGTRARVGLFLRAIRDDEIGAMSRGIAIVKWKTVAFAVSCAICGFAGGLYGTFAGLIGPTLGLILQTGLVISMVVIGGMGTLAGPIIGALLVYVASEVLRDVGNVQMIVFATLVILFARFFRDGLWGIARRLAQRYG
ncbi:MAG: branched-chain amino acid ABC transporter permease [Acetobacteraceae bacterium]